MKIYESIITLFKENGVQFTEREHKPQGNPEEIAKIHNGKLQEGAKAIVLKLKKPDSYCLAVLPANKKLNTKLACNALKVKGIAFASQDQIKELTECEIGAIPPFSFNPNLQLIVDPSLFKNEKILFNAGRLDRSVTINVNDYRKLISGAKIVALSDDDSLKMHDKASDNANLTEQFLNNETSLFKSPQDDSVSTRNIAPVAEKNSTADVNELEYHY